EKAEVRLGPLPDSCTAANSNNVRCRWRNCPAPITDNSLSSDYAARLSFRLYRLDVALSVRTSPGGWRSPERLLKGAGKSGLGTVTDQVGNLRKGRAGIAELLGRDLHAPIGDVVHRRKADQTNETVGQRRTRQADLTAK